MYTILVVFFGDTVYNAKCWSSLAEISLYNNTVNQLNYSITDHRHPYHMNQISKQLRVTKINCQCYH